MMKMVPARRWLPGFAGAAQKATKPRSQLSITPVGELSGLSVHHGHSGSSQGVPF